MTTRREAMSNSIKIAFAGAVGFVVGFPTIFYGVHKQNEARRNNDEPARAHYKKVSLTALALTGVSAGASFAGSVNEICNNAINAIENEARLTRRTVIGLDNNK